jgi:hypothetical protein
MVGAEFIFFFEKTEGWELSVVIGTGVASLFTEASAPVRLAWRHSAPRPIGWIDGVRHRKPCLIAEDFHLLNQAGVCQPGGFRQK